MEMDLDIPPVFPGNHDEGEMPLSMTSPPISLDRASFEMDPIFPVSYSERKILERCFYPMDKLARGGKPLYLAQGYEPGYEHELENRSTYCIALSGTFGNGLPFDRLASSDLDYPSPFGVSLSMSETDSSSPSPQDVSLYGYQDIPSIDSNLTCTESWSSDSGSYGSVISQDGQYIHETSYSNPGSLMPDNAPQIYDTYTDFGQTQIEVLDDLKIADDDFDAEGEPDAMCEDYTVSEQSHSISEMPPKKKSSSDHQKQTKTPASAARKRHALRKAPQSVKYTSRSLPKSAASTERTYACSFRKYGCKSTFNSKNEWKRHFVSQHLKLTYYRCDLKGCHETLSKGPNDFNRKDLFTQHLRRMHSPWSGKNAPSTEENRKFEDSLNEHHRRCLQQRRSPPSQSGCNKCKKVFSRWQDRMEHMGRHYESELAFEEPEDQDLVDWAVREGILCRRTDSSGGFILTDLVNKRNT